MTYVGKPTLSREFGRLNSRLSAVENGTSAQGEVLPFMAHYHSGVLHKWQTCAFISTLSVSHPVVSLEFSGAIPDGHAAEFRLFDCDTGRKSATYRIAGTGSLPLATRWFRVEWEHGIRVPYGRQWHRIALQVMGTQTNAEEPTHANVVVLPGVAVSRPQLGLSGEGSTRWAAIDNPPGFQSGYNDGMPPDSLTFPSRSTES